MLFNRLLTGDWLPRIKTKRGGWRNKKERIKIWNVHQSLCFMMINEEEKHWGSTEGERQRGHTFMCERVHLMKTPPTEIKTCLWAQTVSLHGLLVFVHSSVCAVVCFHEGCSWNSRHWLHLSRNIRFLDQTNTAGLHHSYYSSFYSEIKYRSLICSQGSEQMSSVSHLKLCVWPHEKEGIDRVLMLRLSCRAELVLTFMWRTEEVQGLGGPNNRPQGPQLGSVFYTQHCVTMVTGPGSGPDSGDQHLCVVFINWDCNVSSV